MSFLSWAADVLEKVDQSAAGLSDSNKEGRRRRRRKGPSGGVPPPSDLDGNSGQETDASVESDGRNRGSVVVESLGFTNQEVSVSSVSRLAKAPSLTLEQLKSMQRKLEDRQEWLQPNLKKAFDDSIRKLSQVEAQVSVMVAENEKLRREAAIAAGMNAQELEHLRAETAAAQRNIDDEKNAHTSTRIQAEMRESSLQAENLAYGKALEATQRHAEDKASEAERLSARLAKLEAGETLLEGKVEEATEALSRAQQEKMDARVASGGEAGPRDERGEKRGEIQRQRQEGEEIDRKVAQLEEQLAQHERTAAKWPSAGQREVELERRLRGLNEQLVAKQAQAEAFATERRALDLKLQAALSTKQEQRLGRNEVGGLKRGKTRRGHAASADVSSRGKSGARRLTRFRGSESRGVGSSNVIVYAAEVVESLSSAVGRAVHLNPFLRTLTVGYVMVLHLAVVFMLFHAGSPS